MKKLKIGFFYPAYYPVSASASVHGYQLARGLIKRGHKLLSCSGDANPDCVSYPPTKAGYIKMMLDADILYIRPMSYFEHVVMWKWIKPFKLPAVWEINAPLEEQLVFANSHNLDALKKEISKQNRRRRFYGLFVDGAVCVSEQMKKYAVDFLKIKEACVVPNGSDPKLFNPNNIAQQRPKAWENRFIVLWAGNAALPQQATQLMIAAAGKMKDIDPEVMFVFINSEPGFEFPQEDNIAVLSKINYLSMPGYINNADMCLCLYNSYDFFRYGCYISPLKLFDYMACAKPVIASDMGQISAVIKNNVNGMLTDNRPEDIIDKIIRCKKEPKFSREMGKQARQTIIDHYNWERAARQTEEMLLSKVKTK